MPEKRGSGHAHARRVLLGALTCAAVASGCSVSGHGHASAGAVAKAADAQSPATHSPPASPDGRPPASAVRSTHSAHRSTGKPTATRASTRAPKATPPTRHGSPTSVHAAAPATSPPRLRIAPTGPVGAGGDGGVIAAINAYRVSAGLSALPGYFSRRAQNCAIKNLPSFTGHCLPSGMSGEVYAGVPSQSGSAAAGLWYGEGPGTGPAHEHYNIIMSPHVTGAYYGWAYDARTGSYDVIVDFTANGAI